MEGQRRSPRTRELTPKVTSTKMTISKSTPFFISKHHLDDTQMRSVLHYYDDRTLKNNQRSHSYHAEVLSCANSKPKEHFSTFQQQSNIVSRQDPKSKMEEYYPEKRDKFVQVEIKPKQSRLTGNEVSTTKISKRKGEPSSQIRETKRVSSITQTNDYCLQEGAKRLQAQRKQMRETERMRESNKKNVQRDIRSVSKQKVKELQQEIRQIKIKHLQIERERLLQEYTSTQRQIEPQQRQSKSRQKKHFEFHYQIVNKPRFRFKQSACSDSSFSSFELD